MIAGEQSFFLVGSSGRAIIIRRDAQLTLLMTSLQQICQMYYLGCGSLWRNPEKELLDNVRFRHSAIVIEMLELRGFEHKFLPPYLPFFNGIECMFSSAWKQQAFKDVGQEMKQIFKKELKHMNQFLHSYCLLSSYRQAITAYHLLKELETLIIKLNEATVISS